MYLKSNFLIVVSAPSGGGKTTVCKKILEQSDRVAYSVSYTTRKARNLERDGIDYFFVNEKKFNEMVENNEFLEYAKVHNHLYGTSYRFVCDRLKKGKHVILDIDVEGADQINKSSVDMVSIFLLPPSSTILENRLRLRKTDDNKTIDIRLKNAHEEISRIKNYDYLIINDDLYETVEKVKSIIQAEEIKVYRYNNPEKVFWEEKR